MSALDHATNWKQPFDEDVAKAKDRHQQAIAEAHPLVTGKGQHVDVPQRKPQSPLAKYTRSQDALTPLS